MATSINILRRAAMDDSTMDEARLCKELALYDYVRFSFADLHGINRSISTAKRNVPGFIKQGLYLSKGCLGMGTLSQFIYHDDLNGNENVWCKPKPDTAHALPWAGNKKYKMGGVLCDVYNKNGRPLEICPMQVAKKQIKRLEKMGYTILSSFEMEFTLLEEKTGKPVFEGTHMYSSVVQAALEDYYHDLDNLLAASGVELELLHTEYGPGMLEITMKPQWGIKMADNVLIFKEAAKEIALQKGYSATFMTKPLQSTEYNSGHISFSVWSEDGQNVFAASSENKELSDFAKHWIAGIIQHSGAITALCCPTINCYRRMQDPFLPSQATWGVDNRLVSIRAKPYGQYGTYVENRIPSAAANPYLVLAANVAAGLDGVERSLVCPQEATVPTSGTSLPSNLEEALDALQKDEVFCETIGPDFIKWFLKAKKDCEIALLPNSNPRVLDPDVFVKEVELYSTLL